MEQALPLIIARVVVWINYQ